MSIQLFQSRRSDSSATSRPHHQVGAPACEPIAAASRVLVWVRVCFPLRQERSTQSHENARIKSVLLRVFPWIVLPGKWQSLKSGYHPAARSKARLGRHFVIALTFIAVFSSLDSIANAQRAKVELRVLSDP